MTDDQLVRIAELLRERNAIDDQIAQITNRPMVSGHLGEWIASRVFDIELEISAVAAAIDGRFRAGPLVGKTVNVKWDLKREGLVSSMTWKRPATEVTGRSRLNGPVLSTANQL